MTEEAAEAAEISLYDAPPPMPREIPAELEAQVRLAKLLSTAQGFIPAHYLGHPGNVLAAMFAANSLRIPLWTALQELYVVKGSVGMSATMMRALVMRAGHKVGVSVRRRAGDPVSATVTITRSDGQGGSATYSMTDARRAHLLELTREGKETAWHRHPQAMLVARATSTAARLYAPDVILGTIYLPDELGGEPAGRDLEAAL